MVHKILYGSWKTTTFIAALRHDHVTAPFVLEGAMNGETFRAYVEQILAPTLKRGDIVFMDNVPIHKVAGVREAIEARGGNSFGEFSLPEAILKFRQGVGRLIRTKTDTGIVVVLDNRILAKKYGQAFLDALPKCPVEIA